MLYFKVCIYKKSMSVKTKVMGSVFEEGTGEMFILYLDRNVCHMYSKYKSKKKINDDDIKQSLFCKSWNKCV